MRPRHKALASTLQGCACLALVVWLTVCTFWPRAIVAIPGEKTAPQTAFTVTETTTLNAELNGSEVRLTLHAGTKITVWAIETQAKAKTLVMR